MTNIDNPLLNNLGLPAFDKIQAEHVLEAIDCVLEESRKELLDIEKHSAPNWESLLVPLEKIERKISASWGPVSHLSGVANSEKLREEFNKALPKIVAFSLELSQNTAIFNQLKLIKQSREWDKLSRSKQRAIENRLQEAEFSGIGLNGEKKERFNLISQRLSELSTKFSNNVLDATKAFELVVEEKDDMKDIPKSYLSMWSATYKQKHPEASNVSAESGPWSISLDYASYEAFLKYCTNRQLRESLYKATISRASSGEYDNTQLIYEILRLREEQAQLLGYSSFAELSVKRKMAGNVEAVDKLLNDLTEASRPRAIEELNELKDFAKEQGLAENFANWDLYFYSEKLRKQRFDISDEQVRAYFPMNKVLEGLFFLVERLFAIKVKENTAKVSVWNKDVSYYEIFNEEDELIAGFYLDPYSRPENKRGGAWMDTCIDRGIDTDGRTHIPVAYLVCNATPPSENHPSTLGFREVETLFHEFGHGLQHMLTKVDESSVAGINGIEWDAVELPSQFMENWCYHRPIIKQLSKHVETGERLPDELFEKIKAAKNFQAALAMVRQLHFASIDIELYHRYSTDSKEDIFALNRKIASQVAAMQPLEEDRFLCSFSHIFAGGYAAGYYSYKWAEVLSADAFSRFEEEGLDDDQKVESIGREFRDTVLALGGGEQPMKVFEAFRGREPKIDALLRHSGLL